MKNLLILWMFVFMCLFTYAQDNQNSVYKNVNYKSVDCDQISVNIYENGEINFSTPVNIVSIGLVEPSTGEIVAYLPVKNLEAKFNNQTVDLTEWSEKYEVLIEYKRAETKGNFSFISHTQPCSRRIIIGEKKYY